MRNYVRFVRSIKPRMTRDAANLIVTCYKKLRQADAVGSSQASYRITVRQLESLIRLSEAVARLHCDVKVGCARRPRRAWGLICARMRYYVRGRGRASCAHWCLLCAQWEASRLCVALVLATA